MCEGRREFTMIGIAGIGIVALVVALGVGIAFFVAAGKKKD